MLQPLHCQEPHTHTSHQRGVAPQQGYKPRYHKTTTFVASTGESYKPPDPVAGEDEGAVVEGACAPSNDAGGVYIPDFLCDTPDGNWELNVKLARAMQADEKSRRRCFICDSPDHLMRDCPSAKNSRRPPPLKGPHKNKSAQALVMANMRHINASPLEPLPPPDASPS